MKAGARVVGVGALIFGLISGCQASVNADANVSGDGAFADADASASASGDAELSRPGSEATSSGAFAATSDSLSGPRVLLGARHDLRLKAGQVTPSCECLAVALGGARASGLSWSAATPELDDATQLVIALSSDGVACKAEPKGSLGASYWGYRISGNDVVVLVEAARGGRPLTSGAVIPRPVGSGQVYVKPAFKQLPYGRALDGTELCKLGNPGPPRSTSFSELELGTNATTSGRRSKPAAAGHGSNDDVPTTIEMFGN